jgi:DNA excision repair protein ERCC-1
MPIVCSKTQSANPLMKFITQKVTIQDTGPFDFITNSKQTFYFISIKYHQLNPDYLLGRLGKQLSTHLLCLVDEPDKFQTDLRLINTLATSNNITLFLAFSFREAAQYIETFSNSENKVCEVGLNFLGA